jgi:transposase-like protein
VNKNTIRKSKREIQINSEFWRAVMEQACINQALSIMMEEIEELKQKLRVQLWGRQKGFIRVLGEKVNFPRPRVREDRGEVRLETYGKMQSKRQWGEEITEMVLGGLATRQFDTVARAFGIHYGLSKSAVSRKVVIGLKKDFEALMQTDCSDVIALMVDGINFGKRADQICVIAALGVTRFGVKKLLGIWAGGTENSVVCGALIDDLIARGLQRPQLVVLDGSKALRKAIVERWEEVVIARCQEHKKRNLLGHLSKSHQAWAKREYKRVIHADSYEEGVERAEAFARELRGVNESAYKSFNEGLEEILVPLLIEDKGLRKFFSTTNPLESVFSTIRQKTARVRRWRNANSVMHWICTAYSQQKKNLHKIRGYRNINELFELRSRLSRARKQLKHTDMEREFQRRAA